MPRARRQIEILVVENNLGDARLMEYAFQAAGLTKGFHSVGDGADALAYVRKEGKYADAAMPDLIVLDLSLPEISGLEVLQVLKSTPSLMHIPVVVASGSDDPVRVEAVYALHANCFVRKPLELDEFLRFIALCYEFWGSVVTLDHKACEQSEVGRLVPRVS